MPVMPRLLRLFTPKAVVTGSKRVSDTIDFDLGDGRSIAILRVRDPRARRIKLSVDERGARLSLPARASLVSGDRFLAEHRQWLIEHLDEVAADALPPLQAGATDTLPLRGEDVPLRWSQGRLHRIIRDDAGLRFETPSRVSARATARALRDFYEAEARGDVARWLPKYLAGLPRPPSRIVFKRMSSQWGSLAPDGTLVLDLSLVLATPAAFEYVLVHELCHLVHADHSRRFWAEVETRWPGWREERAWFHANGRRLKSHLHVLLTAA